MAYQRIRQPKLSDVIEQELERLIVEGTLSPGQQLPPERELAKQFEVSRPSIREAIQRLEAKRLLTRPAVKVAVHSLVTEFGRAFLILC